MKTFVVKQFRLMVNCDFKNDRLRYYSKML